MASGPLSGGHSKVYTRKSHTKFPKPSPIAPPSGPTPTAADAGAHPVPSDDVSALHRRGPPTVTISVAAGGGGGGGASRRDLRRRLAAELDQVRALSKRLDAAVAAAAGGGGGGGGATSQLSATDPTTPVSTKRAPPHLPFSGRHHLTVSVEPAAAADSTEKEKRTPKANQYYRDTEFVLGKDKLPPPPQSQSDKKSKSKKLPLDASAERKLYAPAFRSCAALLSKLMKHKHGWVFNKPVNADALGLHDYHTIITHPMDLGTVKARLNSGHYRSPREFAADVRLTFTNAMTYNPKGQDVHVMAEQLLRIFEERWPAIEAELAYLSPQPPPPPPPPIDTRALERSDSTAHPAALDTTPKPHIGRPPALKKPKAKDPNKRDMTYWEKQRLSNNLQSLPPEKLDNVVQIIKRRNLSLSQHDDEIEVDIDSFDVETLWELDRFVTNYKKSLSKNKRKAEIAMLVRQDAEQNAPPVVVQEETQEETIPEAVPAEPPKESVADENEKYVGSSSPVQEDQKGENASRSSSSGSSSSDSGSSSSDTDTDSSSAYGSDAAQSPRT